MDPLSLFTVALGLPAPWEVINVAFDPKSGRIDFHLAFVSGTQFACPHCGRNISRSTTRSSATGVT